jgi:plastocyanin
MAWGNTGLIALALLAPALAASGVAAMGPWGGWGWQAGGEGHCGGMHWGGGGHGYPGLETVEARIVDVDLDHRVIVAEVEGEEVEVMVAGAYVDLESGVMVYGPWLAAQLEPGDEVRMTVAGVAGHRYMLMGIEFSGAVYAHPAIADSMLGEG